MRALMPSVRAARRPRHVVRIGSRGDERADSDFEWNPIDHDPVEQEELLAERLSAGPIVKQGKIVRSHYAHGQHSVRLPSVVIHLRSKRHTHHSVPKADLEPTKVGILAGSDPLNTAKDLAQLAYSL